MRSCGTMRSCTPPALQLLQEEIIDETDLFVDNLQVRFCGARLQRGARERMLVRFLPRPVAYQSGKYIT